jgi:hypothetical protein
MRQTAALAAVNSTRRCQAVGATFRRPSSPLLASQLTFCPRDAFFRHPLSTSPIHVVKEQVQAFEGEGLYLDICCSVVLQSEGTLHCSRDSLPSVAWPIRDFYRANGLHRRQPAGKAFVAERDARSHLDCWTMDPLSQVRKFYCAGSTRRKHHAGNMPEAQTTSSHEPRDSANGYCTGATRNASRRYGSSV